MSALEAASAGVKDMADGSLRITVEFEPRYAKEAFALFGARGTPLAIAALQVGYAAAKEPPVKESLTTEKPKGGPLAKLAGMWCADREFQSWVQSTTHSGIFWPCSDSTEAKLFVCEICEVESRSELDHNEHAAELFHQVIRGPYSKHLMARGIVT